MQSDVFVQGHLCPAQGSPWQRLWELLLWWLGRGRMQPQDSAMGMDAKPLLIPGQEAFWKLPGRAPAPHPRPQRDGDIEPNSSCLQRAPV